MVTITVVAFLGLIAGISALPSPDPIILKIDDGLRYSYLEDDNGQAHLVDNWMKLSDLENMARYNPDSSNNYHLFTKLNPNLSQPLVLNDVNRLLNSNFNARKNTVVIMHGFAGSGTSEINKVLVPAYMAAADCNVIVLDWSAGSAWGPRATQAAQAAGRFINWVNSVTGSTANLYTIVGYSVGGHGAGIMARTVNGNVGFVVGLDPAERYDANYLIQPSDGLYVEIVHTSSIGEIEPLGHVDFYPNGGKNNPGCWTDLCDHLRSFKFWGESVTRGGFTGTKCQTVAQAQSGNCDGREFLAMGGLEPKTGKSGLFYLETNSRQPYSKD